MISSRYFQFIYFFSSVQNNLQSGRYVIKIYFSFDVSNSVQNIEEKWQENVSLFVGTTRPENVVHEEVGEIGYHVGLQESVDQTSDVGLPTEHLEELRVLDQEDVVVAALQCPYHQSVERAVVDDVQRLALAKEIDVADLYQQLGQHESELSKVEDQAALDEESLVGPRFELGVAQVDALADIGHVLTKSNTELVSNVGLCDKGVTGQLCLHVLRYY